MPIPDPAAPRWTPAQALSAWHEADTAELMAWADTRRQTLHGPRVTYTHSLNLNPTNICRNRCGLCAFWREPEDPEAYSLSLDAAVARLEQARTWQLTDLHVVGGLADAQTLDYHLALFRAARRLLPGVVIQGLTAVEIHQLAQDAGRDLETTLTALRDAGLDTLPGGGAEVFAPRVRTAICPNKISGDTWLSVHETAHRVGLRSNATLLFGHIETPEEVIDHWTRLRELQDRSGGFLAFCPLPFFPGGTKLGLSHGPDGHALVRLVALARLFLDNIPHLRVLANYMDRKLLGTLLRAGADDAGGTSVDERIAKAAGAPQDSHFARPQDLAAFIEDLGLHPVLTNSLYRDLRPAPPTIARTAASLVHRLDRTVAGERLDAAGAVRLHEEARFQDLAAAAHRCRLDRVDPDRATFIIDRNISFTNVCTVACRFCAFCRPPGHPEAFVMEPAEVVRRVREAADLGATQIMLQGGIHPGLDLSWYEALLGAIREAVPGIRLHSLSPAEVVALSERHDLALDVTLGRLRDAGLGSLPGGGAEILVDAVRQRVSPAKITADQWFAVMETAHGLGLPTTATLVYGLGESPAQCVEHLLRVRELQDRTGGFRAFIPWSFQARHTRMAGDGLRPRTGPDYLRIVALARLVLDNIDHLQAGWVTEGPDLAQLALVSGADDFGGVLMEESVVKATGIDFGMSVAQIKRLIHGAGFIAAQRDTDYTILRTFPPNVPEEAWAG